MATQTFLELNSYEMHEEQEKLASTMKEIAEGRLSMSAVCRWLSDCIGISMLRHLIPMLKKSVRRLFQKVERQQFYG